MKNIEVMIQAKLLEMQDEGYRDFHCKLIPTINKEVIIGVRTPVLRKFAKEFSKTPQQVEEFLNILPHQYYEENNLHAFLIENMKDYEIVMKRTEAFLPYIDNWATCDCFSPKIFKKNHHLVYEKIKGWLTSPHTYTVRYAIVTLLANYLDAEFQEEMLGLVTAVNSDEYYINMAIAWYLSMAMVKQKEATLPLIESGTLPKWIHNKAIQKSIESYRIDSGTKDYLRSLRRK